MIRFNSREGYVSGFGCIMLSVFEIEREISDEQE
jgi:hypothetical protein